LSGAHNYNTLVGGDGWGDLEPKSSQSLPPK
jgi:hypothetical protein